MPDATSTVGAAVTAPGTRIRYEDINTPTSGPGEHFARYDALRAKGPAHPGVAPIESRGEVAVGRRVLGDLRVEQEQGRPADLHAPDAGVERADVRLDRDPHLVVLSHGDVLPLNTNAICKNWLIYD